MESSYESVIGSQIFTFVVGLSKKEYRVHEAALSSLSKPLNTLLNGPHKEAQELRVEWPDVDEQTFVRFVQWAYTKNYVTEEPDIILAQSDIKLCAPPDGESDLKTGDSAGAPEVAMYSLQSLQDSPRIADRGYCVNRNCSVFEDAGLTYEHQSLECLVCRSTYETKGCSDCGSAWSDCVRCAPVKGSDRSICSNPGCSQSFNAHVNPCSLGFTCPMCKQSFRGKACRYCRSSFTDCPMCYKTEARRRTARHDLIDKFVDKGRINCTATSSTFEPRKNTESCEDYTGVFLCHAKLYVLGDTYDIPELAQLALYRLHATLKVFTLYPSRLNDVATLAKYVFTNTRSQDSIQDMIAHYYACIVEDASKHDGLRSLIEEIPDFAFGLISRMSERLA